MRFLNQRIPWKKNLPQNPESIGVFSTVVCNKNINRRFIPRPKFYLVDNRGNRIEVLKIGEEINFVAKTVKGFAGRHQLSGQRGCACLLKIAGKV